MSRQLLGTNQISGENEETLQEELEVILESLKYYSPPVETVSLLPLEDNVDGEMRFVKEECSVYVWYEDIEEWKSIQDISVELPDDTEPDIEEKELMAAIGAEKAERILSSLGIFERFSFLDGALLFDDKEIVLKSIE